MGATRSRRGAARAVLATITITVAAIAVAVVWHGMATDPETGGYPQRIGFERPSDRLPDRPGPLAATLYDNDFGNGRNLGVTASGRLWELPSRTNLLSPSGNLLLSLPKDPARQVAVHDLVAGERWVHQDLPGPWSPASWSDDETVVLGELTRTHARRVQPAVLDIWSGVVSGIARGVPAGFRSPTEPVTVHTVGDASAPGGIVATTTDLDTGAISRLSLQLTRPWRGDPDAGLRAAIAPDGQVMLIVEQPDGSSDATVRLFSLTDGTELAARTVPNWDGCSPTWRGHDPVLPTTTQPGGSGSTRWAGASLLTPDGATSLVAVHPRLQSSCLQLTPAALAAGPRWSLLGTSTAIWAWYPLPALVVVSPLALGLVLLVRVGRRRWAGGRRHPGTQPPGARRQPARGRRDLTA